MSRDESVADRAEPDEPRDAPDSAYVPPAAEDIDTSYGPAEASAGVPISGIGVEESSRWH
jgi:hypothetical protein